MVEHGVSEHALELALSPRGAFKRLASDTSGPPHLTRRLQKIGELSPRPRRRARHPHAGFPPPRDPDNLGLGETRSLHRAALWQERTPVIARGVSGPQVNIIQLIEYRLRQGVLRGDKRGRQLEP